MDWKIFGTTFVTLFLAEMGDKTQLAVIAAVSKTGKPWTVFLSAALALVAVTAIGAGFGEALSRMIAPEVLEKIAGGAFVLIGVLILVDIL